MKKGNFSPVKVAQYDLDGNFVAEFDSMCQASKKTGIRLISIQHSSLNNNSRGGNYMWVRLIGNEKPAMKIKAYNHTLNKATAQYDLNGNLLRVFPSRKAAKESIDFGTLAINSGSTIGAYQWKDSSNGLQYNIDPVKNINKLKYNRTIEKRNRKTRQVVATFKSITGMNVEEQLKPCISYATSYSSVFDGNRWGVDAEAARQARLEKHKVLQYDFDGNFVNEYASVKEAAEAIGCSKQYISYASKNATTAMGYQWRKKTAFNGGKLRKKIKAVEAKRIAM